MERRLEIGNAKNDDYFEFENNQRLPYLDAVAVSFIIDKQAAFMEFVKGNLDFYRVWMRRIKMNC